MLATPAEYAGMQPALIVVVDMTYGDFNHHAPGLEGHLKPTLTCSNHLLYCRCQRRLQHSHRVWRHR